MIDRSRALLVAVLLGLGVSAPAGAASHRATAAVTSDLTGTWTNAWYTWLERRKGFTSLVATPAEAEAYEAPRRKMHGEIVSKQDTLGQNESEFPDNGPGLARIRGQIRTGWIIDTPDGKAPWTKDARARLGLDTPPPEKFDNVEDRDTSERCLTTEGAGAPILNAHDANLIEIVQTPNHVLVVTEKNHEVRIIRLNAPPPGPGQRAPGVNGWMGDSVGHWEGKTLVVETTGLRPGLTKLTDQLTLSEHSRVVERFTRTGPAEITYAFEVSDPTLFTQVWHGEMVFRPAEGRMFEYACHEGNYSLPGILIGGQREAALAAAKPKAP